MAANSRGPREDAEGDGGGERDVTETTVTGELPEGLTVEETLEWVSNDKGRAQAALDAENGRDKPRSGVVSHLERLLNEDTGAGVASGEA